MAPQSIDSAQFISLLPEAMAGLLRIVLLLGGTALAFYVGDKWNTKNAMRQRKTDDMFISNLDHSEKPKNGLLLTDDGELAQPIEVDYSYEKPKRGLPRRRTTTIWAAGFVMGLLVVVIAFNVIPGLKPATRVYPADDAPRVVITPALPGPDLSVAMDTASTCFTGLFPLLIATAVFGLGIGLMKWLVLTIRGDFR